MHVHRLGLSRTTADSENADDGVEEACLSQKVWAWVMWPASVGEVTPYVASMMCARGTFTGPYTPWMLLMPMEEAVVCTARSLLTAYSCDQGQHNFPFFRYEQQICCQTKPGV